MVAELVGCREVRMSLGDYRSEADVEKSGPMKSLEKRASMAFGLLTGKINTGLNGCRVWQPSFRVNTTANLAIRHFTGLYGCFAIYFRLGIIGYLYAYR